MKRCACGKRFVPRSNNHMRCSACAIARAFERLRLFNELKRNGGDMDRRRHPEIKCDGCGMSYAGFRAGFSFGDARRDFITDDPNRRTGRRRHGRRNGVLGKMREWKQLAWKAHVVQCENARQEGRVA